jgi:hypothetical protein
MVNDSLWSDAGGHSWQDADEFFASAFAGFRRDPKLLRTIVKYYSKADPAILDLSKELFEVLEAVANDQKLAKLASLGDDPRKAAEQEVQTIRPPVDFSQKGGVIGYLIDPSTMPAPDRIRCP